MTDVAEERRPDAAPAELCVFSPTTLFEVAIEDGAGGAPEVHFHAAGQGLWIARMATRLGVRVTLCAPFGGEPGEVLRALAEDEGITVQAVVCRGWNGGAIQDRRGGGRAVVAEVASPRLTRHEADELYNAALGAGLSAGNVVLAGSAYADVLPLDTYGRLARDLGDNGVRVTADLSGEALKALEGGVRCLKVAHGELIEAGYCDGDAPEQLAAGARRLRDSGGARAVIVSRAAEPVLALLDDDRVVEAEAPRFQAREHRGAGDSMTAGLAVGLARGLDPMATLRLAAAAGALNVTRHGLGSGRRHAIEEIAGRVELRPIDV